MPAIARRSPSADPLPPLEEERRRGRGALTNPSGRFERERREDAGDGWDIEEERAPFETTVTVESARSMITRNLSPDIPFDRSVNPYRGCEHGCVYCFARPMHSFLGWSAGLDFETKLIAKANAADVLEREFSAPGYEPKTLQLGTATDPYQPIERRWKLTRQILELCERTNHPVGIVTKSALILRDIDVLGRLAAKNLVKVATSVTTLDPRLARGMEPRASTPKRRLGAIRALAEAGIPVTVMVAPIIPALNDHEIEAILEACREAGAREAGYVLLRLPHEVKDLFAEWLLEHEPGRYRHVMNLVRATRGGKDYDPSFGSRMVGEGPYAWMLSKRFDAASRRLGYARTRLKLDPGLFRRPTRYGEQLSLL
jgi:DNA repair photolyase